ncbi:MAG: DNA repair protein RecO [Alphaproteobacteria bacterium]|nr:DNA repair protein RecO [Alphaproteobacteria bacterium]
MKLESNGILIGLRPIGERDCVAMIFTRDFGMLHGVLRGAQVAKKNRALVGQVGVATWSARLESQLGAFHWEIGENPTACLMGDMQALACINAMFALVGSLLPEREAYESLYDLTVMTLGTMSVDNAVDEYQKWEIGLLRELGYALDLSHCSGCGKTQDLNYLSPKTGRAVCNDCAAPYVNKLYHLPVTLDTTMNFISGVCQQQGVDVPAARLYLSRMGKFLKK